MTHPICNDITRFLESWAPLELAAPWDNVGLQIGDPSLPIKSILLSLDVDRALLNTLNHTHYDLVITHHPLFFKPVKSLHFSDDMGQAVTAFLTHKTQLYTLHTNLDAAVDGVNDCLVEAYGFTPKKGHPIEGGFGKWFQLDAPMSLSELTSIMPCTVLGHQKPASIKRVGFLGGSGHGMLNTVSELNIDCFITGEITYHDEVFCDLNAITTLALGHKQSEELILPKMQAKLQAKFPAINVTTIDEVTP